MGDGVLSGSGADPRGAGRAVERAARGDRTREQGGRRARWRRTRCSAAGAGSRAATRTSRRATSCRTSGRAFSTRATNLTARDGYASLKVEEIAEQAAVSLVAFYEHFADKEDAFLVAYEVGFGKALAVVERAFAAESDWRQAVRAGIDALFGFLASEPAFAQIALIDALIVTPHTAERSTESVSAFARMLVPGERADRRRAFRARSRSRRSRAAVRSLLALRARGQDRRAAGARSRRRRTSRSRRSSAVSRRRRSRCRMQRRAHREQPAAELSARA